MSFIMKPLYCLNRQEIGLWHFGWCWRRFCSGLASLGTPPYCLSSVSSECDWDEQCMLGLTSSVLSIHNLCASPFTVAVLTLKCGVWDGSTSTYYSRFYSNLVQSMIKLSCLNKWKSCVKKPQYSKVSQSRFGSHFDGLRTNQCSVIQTESSRTVTLRLLAAVQVVKDWIMATSTSAGPIQIHWLLNKTFASSSFQHRKKLVTSSRRLLLYYMDIGWSQFCCVTDRYHGIFRGFCCGYSY